MKTISEEEFQNHLDNHVDVALKSQQPLKITLDSGHNVIVLSRKEWEREQETLYVMQNKSLMEQIRQSITTYQQQTPLN